MSIPQGTRSFLFNVISRGLEALRSPTHTFLACELQFQGLDFLVDGSIFPFLRPGKAENGQVPTLQSSNSFLICDQLAYREVTFRFIRFKNDLFTLSLRDPAPARTWLDMDACVHWLPVSIEGWELRSPRLSLTR